MTSSAGQRRPDFTTSSLEDLRRRYPDEWKKITDQLLGAMGTGRAEDVAALVGRARAEAEHWRARLRSSGGNAAVAKGASGAFVRERMMRLALEQTTLALASGETHGTVRLGLWSGTIVQRLFFSRGFARKAASMGAFRVLWPIVRDKRIVMPLLRQRGIYCLYSRPLVRGLLAAFAGRPCLEIAAGDGALAGLLRAEGVEITATDDGSWSSVTLGTDVVRCDARAALKRYPVPVVLCAWPPAGNAFEWAVFQTESVETYIVLASRHRFASGDWEAYDRQRAFELTVDKGLSRTVLPPEIDPLVLIFRRRGQA